MNGLYRPSTAPAQTRSIDGGFSTLQMSSLDGNMVKVGNNNDDDAEMVWLISLAFSAIGSWSVRLLAGAGEGFEGSRRLRRSRSPVLNIRRSLLPRNTSLPLGPDGCCLGTRKWRVPNQ